MLSSKSLSPSYHNDGTGENKVACSSGQEEKIMSLFACLKMKWIALAKARGWGETCTILQVAGMSAWCIFDVPHWVCTSVGELEDLLFNIMWCGGSMSAPSMMWWISVQHPVWMLQTSGVTGVPLDAQNSFGILWCTYGKYCTHLMSGLGSGMPRV